MTRVSRAKVLAALRGAADPARAPAMQAYMKSTMPFLGVAAEPLRAVCRASFTDYAPASRDDWMRDVLTLWRGAKYREERYAAIWLTQHRAARAWHDATLLPFYEELVVTGAWWDLVDALLRSFAAMLRNDPVPTKRAMRAWSRDANMWKRRVSILCQLGAREGTDLALLYDCIAPSLGEQEFFLRKAIGWALRQLARSQPDEVRRYVREHAHELSSLSRREALKHLGGDVSAPGPKAKRAPQRPAGASTPRARRGS